MKPGNPPQEHSLKESFPGVPEYICLGINLLQKGGEFLSDTMSRKDILLNQEASWLIILQVMTTQHPTDGWQHQLPKRQRWKGRCWRILPVCRREWILKLQ